MAPGRQNQQFTPQGCGQWRAGGDGHPFPGSTCLHSASLASGWFAKVDLLPLISRAISARSWNISTALRATLVNTGKRTWVPFLPRRVFRGRERHEHQRHVGAGGVFSRHGQILGSASVAHNNNEVTDGQESNRWWRNFRLFGCCVTLERFHQLKSLWINVSMNKKRF